MTSHLHCDTPTPCGKAMSAWVRDWGETEGGGKSRAVAPDGAPTRLQYFWDVKVRRQIAVTKCVMDSWRGGGDMCLIRDQLVEWEAPLHSHQPTHYQHECTHAHTNTPTYTYAHAEIPLVNTDGSYLGIPAGVQFINASPLSPPAPPAMCRCS